MHGLSSLPIGTLHGIEEDISLLTQEARPIRGRDIRPLVASRAQNGATDIGEHVVVHDLVIDNIGERIIPCTQRSLVCPSSPHEQIQWDATTSGGDQLRALVDNKVHSSILPEAPKF